MSELKKKEDEDKAKKQVDEGKPAVEAKKIDTTVKVETAVVDEKIPVVTATASTSGDKTEIKTVTTEKMPEVIKTVVDKIVTSKGGPIDQLGAEKIPIVKMVPAQIGTILWKEKFHSELDFIESPVYARKKWTFRTKIGNFNSPKTYIEARVALARLMLSRYDGVLHNIKKELVPIFNRALVTSESQIGFPGYSFVTNTLLKTPNEFRAYVTELANLSITDVIDPNPRNNANREYVPVCAHPSEIGLQNILSTMNLSRLMEIDEMYQFLAYLTDQYHIMVPPPMSVDRRFNKTIRPGPFNAYYDFINANSWMRGFVCEMHRDMIVSHLKVKFEQRQTTVMEMLKAYELRTTQLSSVSDLNGIMVNAEAKILFDNILTTLMMGKYCRLEMDVVFKQFNSFTLISCILMKLLIPIQLMTARSITMIDNCIFKLLVFRMMGVNTAAIVWDDMRAEQGEVNYMTYNRNRGIFLDARLGNAFWDVFASTQNGRGWGGTELNGMAGFPAGDFIGRNDVFFAYFAGRDIVDPEITKTLQFLRYSALITEMERAAAAGRSPGEILRYGRTERNEWDVVAKTLRMINIKWATASYMAKTIDLIQRRIAMMSTVAPTFPVEQPSPIGSTFIYNVPVGAPMALFFLGNFDGRTSVSLETTYIRWGWAMHEFFNDLVEKYWYIQSKYATNPQFKQYWTKKDRINMALSMVEFDPGVKGQFDTLIRTDTNMESIIWPPANRVPSIFTEKMRQIDEFIWTNRLLFGFNDRFYCTAKYDIGKPAYFLNDWRSANDINVILNIDWRSLDEQAQTVLFKQTVRRVKDARDGSAIQFNIPVKVDTKEVTDIFNEPEIVHAELGQESRVNTLTYYYTWFYHINEDIEYKLTNQIEPRFVIRNMPFIDRDADYIRDLFGYTVAFKEQFKLWFDFTAVATTVNNF